VEEEYRLEVVEYRPIGIIHTPFTKDSEIPRQAASVPEISGTVILHKKYTKGLLDLDGFSHILIVFHFHLATFKELVSYPPWDKKHGVFSTCSPYRPNPIGISVVKLDKIVGNKLHISGVDMVDGTPVLDIKPYIPGLYPKKHITVGWLDKKTKLMNLGKSRIIFKRSDR
jgi:tRNA-Thr(GGU) m(6)t(6)A37 methyltransferase TsaA